MTPIVPLAGTTVSTVPPPETTAEVTAVPPEPPTLTVAAVAPVKLVPLITNEPPSQPDEEPKLVMVGGSTHFTLNAKPV